MDSLTQAALGATVAGAIAGKRCTGKVLLAGAALGTLPDLDVLIDYGNDISNVVKHRGFSHSLLVLLPFSLLLSGLIQYFKPLPQWSFTRLWLLVASCLITHPLLDYFTSYGTQLLWPLVGYYSHSSVFIIDPLYTLPLLFALLLTGRNYSRAMRYCSIALLCSSLYLAWSHVAKHLVLERAEVSLAKLNLPAEQIFIAPTPFNTLLWRIVVLDGNRYWEGTASFFDKHPDVRFVPFDRGQWPLTEQTQLLRDYLFFTQDFVQYQQRDGKLLVADLRLGAFGRTAFEFQFAEKQQDAWLLDEPYRVGSIPLDGDFSKMWQRLLGDQSIDPRLGDCSQCTDIDMGH